MNNIFGMVQQLLLQKRMNVSQGIPMNDPQAILNHLLQTGQVTQQQVNQAYQRAQTFKQNQFQWFR